MKGQSCLIDNKGMRMRVDPQEVWDAFVEKCDYIDQLEDRISRFINIYPSLSHHFKMEYKLNVRTVSTATYEE